MNIDASFNLELTYTEIIYLKVALEKSLMHIDLEKTPMVVMDTYRAISEKVDKVYDEM